MFATASGTNNASCQNCDTTTTPLWRRAEDGTNLCNACGLFLRLHGKSRPITLKSNVIRSRNRVRNPQSNKRKTPYDAPATPGEIARQQQQQQQQQHAQQQQSQHLTPYDPHPRSLLTASQQDESHAQFTENVFDPQLSNPTNQVDHAANPFEETSGDGQDVRPDSELAATNRALQARINELEIVNGLFQNHQVDLEAKLEKFTAELLDISATDAKPEDLRRLVGDLQRRVRSVHQQDQQQQDGQVVQPEVQEEVRQS